MDADFGYVRVGTAVPDVRAADVAENVASMAALARDAEAAGCAVTVFPELCITGYTCADLFHQAPLLRAAEAALGAFAAGTAGLDGLFAVGLPCRVGGELFNVAVLLQQGRLLGAVPKTFLPGFGEYYEPRWFAPGANAPRDTIALCGQEIPFGVDLIFASRQCRDLVIGMEICEDLWAVTPPSSQLALAGATILLNLSAGNELVGKCGYRHDLVRQQSARCLAAYVYCAAGVGESTTDMVFGGDAIIAENGRVLHTADRFERRPHLTVADVDPAFLQHERARTGTFGQCRRQADTTVRRIAVDCALRDPGTALRRPISRSPFVPSDPAQRHERCQEIFAIQSTGLATRLAHTGIDRVVIGLSGGLDSTLALLVCLDAFDRLGLPISGIHAITMPAFGTTDRTLGNVEALCTNLGVTLDTIPLADACEQHFGDIGHDGTTHDVAFENVQARERTQVLMDRANMVDGLVIGTGDLSELALGWCTYNGDHMSMYAVNTGVPKTLVQYLIAYFADDKADAATATTLRDILDTPISPELLPPDANGLIAQKTESVVGPYELHDFFLYHLIRCGFTPAKVARLAGIAFAEAYSNDEVARWLEVFCRRFFSQQFKRSCLPDGPKVGTIALSPRGDWRMPSDAAADDWLRSLNHG